LSQGVFLHPFVWRDVINVVVYMNVQKVDTLPNSW